MTRDTAHPKIRPGHLQPPARRLRPPVEPASGPQQPREFQPAIRPGRAREGAGLGGPVG